MWARWVRYAFICRSGNQRIVDLIGRQPTRIELALFERALLELLKREYPTEPESKNVETFELD